MLKKCKNWNVNYFALALLTESLFLKKNLFIYVFIFGCVGSLLLCTGVL